MCSAVAEYDGTKSGNLEAMARALKTKICRLKDLGSYTIDSVEVLCTDYGYLLVLWFDYLDEDEEHVACDASQIVRRRVEEMVYNFVPQTPCFEHVNREFIESLSHKEPKGG
jgi:hypothetical protein